MMERIGSGIDGTRRLMVIAALAVALAAGTLAFGATSAAAAWRSGTVTCANGFGQLVGVWVDVGGGGSGWAWWRPYSGRDYTPNGQQSGFWGYNVPSGRSYRLSVGCGGTKSAWGSNYSSSWTTWIVHWTCVWNYGSYYGYCVKAQ